METALEEVKYASYKRRFWYALVVIAINVSNAMTWISYAPITFQTNAYYSSNYAATSFNVIYMLFSIPMGFVAVWGVDRFGLRGGCVIGGGLNLIGNIVRFIGSCPFMPLEARFPVAFTGQCLAAIAQPFIIYLPTKLTAFWFPEDQRNLANTLTSMSNPVGIALMYSVSPQIVNNDHPDNFVLLTGITGIIALVAGVMSCTVLSSEPPSPVSGSKAVALETPSFKEGLKMSLRNKQFMVLVVCLGGGVGLFNALYNNLQPALCTKGYSETFSGLMGAVLIFAGLVGAACAGALTDYRKEWTEKVMKLAFGLANIGAASLCVAINYEGEEWWIVLSICVFGFAGFALYPVGLETGVEVTYPVAEATSTGIIMMSGQLQGVIFVLLTAIVNTKPTPTDIATQTCTALASESATIVGWKYSFIMWQVFVTLLGGICIIFFHPTLRRLQQDKACIEAKSTLVDKSLSTVS